MAIHLPPPIADYLEADKAADPDAVAACFTNDAVVRDEGREERGRDAVRAWKARSSQAYSYTTDPFAMVGDGDRASVTSRVTGDFPGSPIDLRYDFVLRDGKIAVLEIAA